MSEYKYQEENDQVLDFIINHTFFINQKRDYTLELILTPECNQKCEYCYLQKYKHDLYPKESYEHDKVLQNLDYLFNFLKENNIYIPKIDLFSGEIWGSEFGIAILDKVYNHYKNYKFSNKIGIPSNMTFLLNSKYKILIQKYIDLFKELNVKLYFSASVDGKILEETSRPLNSGKVKEDNFYKEVFEFAQKNNFGFHPMLSATNVYKWKENFDWFIQEYQKYEIIGMAPMILEVRDNNWNADSLNSYKEFLNYIITYYHNKFINTDKENDFIYNIFCIKNNIFKLAMPFKLTLNSNQMSCSLQRHLCIRVGDLAIVPCHRTCYDNFIYGNFKVEKEKITGITARNVELANFLVCTNPNITFPKCVNCKYKDICMKGCLGSQFEYTHDLFEPCPTVCDLYETKYGFLIKTYRQMGYITKLENLLKSDKTLTDAERKRISEMLKVIYSLEKEI